MIDYLNFNIFILLKKWVLKPSKTCEFVVSKILQNIKQYSFTACNKLVPSSHKNLYPSQCFHIRTHNILKPSFCFFLWLVHMRNLQCICIFFLVNFLQTVYKICLLYGSLCSVNLWLYRVGGGVCDYLVYTN